MTSKQQQMFSIPTEMLEALLLTDELLTTPERVAKVDAVGGFSQEYLDGAEEKAKADAVRSWYRSYHKAAELRETVSVRERLPNGEELRGYRKKDEATLEQLEAAESDYWKRANANYREAVDLRAIAKERFGVQIGLPFEFEARRPKPTRAVRKDKPRAPRQPEDTK